MSRPSERAHRRDRASRRLGRKRLGRALLLAALFAACTRDPGSTGRPSRAAGSETRSLATTAPVMRGVLRAGQSRHGVVAAGAIDRYQIALAAGDAVALEVSQDAVDLVVRLSDPDARPLLVFDSPILRLGPERLCAVATSEGLHAIDISPFAGPAAGRDLHAPGHAYTLHLLRVRPATPSDRDCARAAARFAQGEHTRDAGAKGALDQSAGELWSRAGEPFLAAMAWRQAATARTGRDLPGAIDQFARALAEAQKARHRGLEISIRNRLAMAHEQAGDFDRAAHQLDTALTIARASSDLRGIASTLTNRGLIDMEMGHPFRALERDREALALWRKAHNRHEIAQTLEHLADALGVIDHHDEALDALDQALDLAIQEGEPGLEADILVSRGWIHHLRGHPDEAVAPIRRALEIRRRQRDDPALAGVLDRLGTVLRAAGQPAAAEAPYRDSLSISRRLGLNDYQAATETNLGCLLAETDRTDEAALFLQQALAYYRGKGQDPKAWSHTEYCLARLERHLDDLDGGLEHVGKALAIVEALRQDAREKGHHYRPIWLWQDYAELEIALLLDRARSAGPDGRARDLAAAFAAADRARARTLFELVVTTRQGASNAARHDRDQQARRIEQRLSELGAVRTTELAGLAPGSDSTVDAEIRRQRLALERIRSASRADALAVGALGLPRPVTAEQARHLLDPRTALLTYVLDEARSHLLVLTRDRLSAFDLPPREELEAHAEALYHALRTSRSNHRQWRLAAAALGRTLLAPGVLPAGIERLVINAEGALLYVPFGVLASPRGAPGTPAAQRLVLDDFELVSVPSAAVWAALRQRRRSRPPATKTVAVIADPVFSPSDPRLRSVRAHAPSPRATRGRPAREPATRASPHDARQRGISVDRLPSGPLPRLPATAREADSILHRVSPSQRLDLRGLLATKEAVLARDLRGFRMLHFATHAWIDERFPELSGLLLSRFDAQGMATDGAFYLHDIDRLDLRADLTVLSGCQTALGQRVRGDGLLGLTQGFFHAGSSQVMVSLWSLDDAAAAKLMAELYRRMLDLGEPPATALRAAQRWMRAQDAFQAPRYWAPFVLQGDG